MRKSKNLKLNTHLISSISFKLSGSFCLLIGFIAVVGVSAYTSASNAIKSIYFFSDTTSSISTNKKSTLYIFFDYTQSEQCAQQYYWYGKPSVIDEVLNIDIDSYVNRMVKAFYRQNSFLAMDIDKQAVLDVLNKLKYVVTGKAVETALERFSTK